MPKPYAGQCLCGACKIFVDDEPMMNGLGLCHCKDCSRSSGSAFACAVALPTESVRVEGPVTDYSFVNALSGNTIGRWFCPRCGSLLFSRSSSRPHRTAVFAGNIEAFTKLPVILEVFTKSRWPSILPIQGALQCEDGDVKWSALKPWDAIKLGLGMWKVSKTAWVTLLVTLAVIYALTFKSVGSALYLLGGVVVRQLSGPYELQS
ncbi:hypothetical protein APHAL10511_006652 [Amanita phalloides]|nr:hypothetical protein APHAL10511_006652 [Amanita phalloides]